ncbi:hypothetical protein [Eilatimonas milleporae]|uniref:Uncharacterized protein n=1 Tax=Eilatimonas milleporae TaxID=911205 RepID=A0A3M0C8J7_9PROT|nr:hypothetical protein [Eilatimonas milleporae]RMB04680.1 hypothetical protein BXY39_2951 [Eilatimonas milleporae]
MPIYFKIRDNGANQLNPPPELLTQPNVNPGNIQKAPQAAITAYLDGTGNPSLPVYFGNCPTMAFGNIAQYRMHNFDTGLIMNGAMNLNAVRYGNFLALFDDVYLEVTNFPGSWAHLEGVAHAFGEAYRRIIAELAGTSITIAVSRRIVNNLFRDANTVPVLADYDQVRRHFNINQNANRADYVWLMFTRDVAGNVFIDNTMIAEAKGSLRRRAPNVGRIDTAITQTIESVAALNGAGFTADGVSEALYTLDPTPMNPQLEDRWEINLIDPGKEGKPVKVDWNDFYTFAAPKFAYMTADDTLSHHQVDTIGNGKRTVDVVPKSLSTGAGTYVANLPLDVFDAATSMESDRGEKLFDAISKYRKWMGGGKEQPASIEANDYGDYFFGSLFFPGDGYFIQFIPDDGGQR